MANISQLPATELPGYESETSSVRAGASLQSVPVKPGAAAHENKESTSLPVIGPRKLIRPTLLPRTGRGRAYKLREEPAILAHQSQAAHATAAESSHAEAFYFQKQVQTQTPMVIVLEDGEQVEGCIEWYDRYAIKVKGSSRVLIYKSAIKYIYKVGER